MTLPTFRYSLAGGQRTGPDRDTTHSRRQSRAHEATKTPQVAPPVRCVVSVHPAFCFPSAYCDVLPVPVLVFPSPSSPLTIFWISFLQPSLLFLPPLALLLMCSWQLWLRESRRFYPMCHWASSRETSVWERVATHRKTQRKSG